MFKLTVLISYNGILIKQVQKKSEEHLSSHPVGIIGWFLPSDIGQPALPNDCLGSLCQNMGLPYICNKLQLAYLYNITNQQLFNTMVSQMGLPDGS